MTTLNVQESLFDKLPLHCTTLMSSPNFHTYSLFFLNHSSPYIQIPILRLGDLCCTW